MAKCTNCGFLGIWDRVKREWLYANEYFRAEGRDEFGGGSGLSPAKCFVLAADLALECGMSTAAGVQHERALLDVLHGERSCDAWVKWQPGFTPKEHREMLDRQWQIDWQARREDADREWREQQRLWDLRWRSEQDALARRDRRIERRLAVIGIALATAAVIAAAFIQVNGQRQTTQMLIDATKPVAPPTLPAINE